MEARPQTWPLVSRGRIVYISAVSRKPFLALLFILASTYTGCASKGRPAIEMDDYLKYRDQAVVTLRPGLLTYYSELPRGLRYHCMEPPPKLSLFQSFSRGNNYGPVEVERRIDAGEKAKIEEIVRFDGMPGLYARAALLKDEQECVIPLGDGLMYRLIFTAAELEEFNRIPEETRELIINRQVRTGMSAQYVLYTLGVPNERIPGVIPGSETWTYIPQMNRIIYVEFENGVLKSFRE